MSKIEELIKKLCPNGVEYKTIGELFDVKNGYTPSKNNKYFWENGNIPWFRMDDIRTNGNILNDATQHITELAIKNRKFPKDSLIVATTATIGVHALIKCDFVCNQQLTCVAIKEKLKNDLNIKFCFYYFDIIDEQCKKIANQGGGMPIVSLEKMKKLVFPVPPLEVQCEIVHILDDFTLLSAELSAELKARQKQYEFYRDKLLYFDEKIPRRKLIDVSSISRGKRVTKKDLNENNEFPVYQNSLAPMGYYKDYNYEKNKTYIISAGAAGEIGFCKENFWAADDCLVVYNLKEVLDKYVYYYLLVKQDYIKANVRKASIPRLSREIIKNIEIPIPSLERQEEIVNILDKLDKLCNDISEGLPAEIEARQKQYEYYRDKLLTFKELKVNE